MLLVTGATGFIGSHLAGRLVAEGRRVRCLVRKTSSLKNLDGLDVEYAYGDLAEAGEWDDGKWRSVLDGVETVFHVAGVTKAKSPEGFRQGNVVATGRLLEGCLRRRPGLDRLIHVSSLAAIGPCRDGRLVDEQTPPAPLSAYGRSKLAGERLVWRVRDRLPVTIVRPPAVYGPRDRDILEFYKTVRNGIQPRVGGRNRYLSLLHGADLASALVRAWQTPEAAGEVFFVANDDPADWDSVSTMMARMMGKKTVAVNIPERVAFGVGCLSQWVCELLHATPLLTPDKVTEMVQDRWVCDTAKARRVLGFRQEISLEDGIRATMEWYQREGWL